MPVGSPLEIYTTVLAWHVYTGFWQLLASVGLIYAPFAAIIFRNLLDARKNASSTDVGIRALRVAEMEFYIALFVLLFFAAPTINLRVNNVAYTHTSCEIVGNTLERTTERAAYGATHTTYDEAIGSPLITLMDGEQAKVPIIWWFVSHYLRAIPEAAKQLLPCNPDLRLLATETQNSRISDPLLRDELAMFERDCWRYSINKFLREKPSIPASIEDIATDTAWAGSRFFLTTPGYYDQRRVQEPLRSFQYNQARDEVRLKPEHAEGRGMPFCREWWDSETEGLRRRLLADTELDSTTNWRYLARRVFGSENTREAQDALLYGVLTMDAQLQANRLTNAYPRDEQLLGLVENGKAGLATLGLAVASPVLYTTIYAIKQAAPMFQAIILCFVIMVMGLLHVVSAYSLSTAITLVFVVGSIQFWSFIFAFCHWLDTSLWQGATQYDGSTSLSMLVDNRFAANFLIIDFVIGAMYVLLPSLFTVLMAVAGSNVGSTIASMSGSQTTGVAGQGAGGVSMVTKGATQLIKK